MDTKQVQEAVLSGEKGIYTLTASDLETVHDIEKMKNLFLMELDDMSKTARMNQFASLLSSMKIFMEKYGFKEYMLNEKVDNEFTFDYVKKTVFLIDGNPILVRRGCEIAFTVWESVLKKLGVGLPTSSFRAEDKINKIAFRAISSL